MCTYIHTYIHTCMSEQVLSRIQPVWLKVRDASLMSGTGGGLKLIWTCRDGICMQGQNLKTRICLVNTSDEGVPH